MALGDKNTLTEKDKALFVEVKTPDDAYKLGRVAAKEGYLPSDPQMDQIRSLGEEGVDSFLKGKEQVGQIVEAAQNKKFVEVPDPTSSAESK